MAAFEPPLNYDRLSESRQSFVQKAMSLDPKEAITEFTNLAGIQSMTSESMRDASELQDKDTEMLSEIFTRQAEETDPQTITRDFLLGTLYLPPHLIPFMGDLEYIPDKLIATVMENLMGSVVQFFDQEDLERKSKCLKIAFQYLAKRIECDPSAELTVQLADMAIRTNNISPCLNNPGDPLKDLMANRAAVFTFILENYKMRLEDEPNAEKGRIGILCSHVGQGDCTLYALALLESLSDEGLEPLFICDSAIATSIQKKAEDLAGRTILLPKGIKEASQLVYDLRLETLIFTDAVHNSENPAFLLALQNLAPNQVVVQSTILTTGFPHLSSLLVSENSLEQEELLTENAIPIEGLASMCCVELPVIEEEHPITKEELMISEGDLVFISAASPDCISPQTREIWMSLLKQIPEAKLLLTPFLDASILEGERENFVATMEHSAVQAGVSRNRLLIMNDILGTVYHLDACLALSNIYLEAFPCNTLFPAARALKEGLPVVTIKGNTMREKATAVLLEEQGLSNMIATSTEEYLQIASELASSKTKVQIKTVSLKPLADAVSSLMSP
jgi:hypothetical protein